MIHTHEQVSGGEEYLGFARKKLEFMDRMRKESGIPSLAWGPCDVGGATIYIRSSDDGNLIRIDGISEHAFIITPRMGSVAAADFTKLVLGEFGYIPVVESHQVLSGYGLRPVETGMGKVKIAGAEAAFPLDDDRYGNVRRLLLRDDDGQWLQEVEPPYLAGNIDWTGKDSSPEEGNSNAEVLTWKGPPGRHLPLDATLYIPYFTELDETVGEVEYYTPFGPNVYQGGAVYATLPNMGSTTPKVLGAALCGGVLVVIAGVNYRGMTNPEQGTGGFYDEVWINDGEWRRIGWNSGSRPYLPWFFNQSGTAATNQSGRFDINIQEETVAYIAHTDTGSGTVTEQRDPDYSVVKSGSWRRFYEYRGDELVYATIELSSSDTSTHDSDSDSWENTVPYKIQAPADRVITISGDRVPSVNSTYTANGGCCGTWSGDGLTLDSTGKVTAITGCGCGKVHYTDADGVSAKFAVKLPGVWVLVSSCSKAACTCGSSCGIVEGLYWTPPYIYDDDGCVIKKTEGTIQCCSTSEPSCVPYCGLVQPEEIAGTGCSSWCEGVSGRLNYWTGKDVYEWRCP